MYQHDQQQTGTDVEAQARDELGAQYVTEVEKKVEAYKQQLFERLIALKRDLDDSSLSKDEVDEELQEVLNDDQWLAGDGNELA